MPYFFANIEAAVLAVTVLSAVVAITALIFSARALVREERQSIATEILDLWDRYERYSEGVRGAKTPDEALIRAINLLNFIENIARIYNLRLGSRELRENILGLFTDFVSGEEELEFMGAVREAAKTSDRTFEETRRLRAKVPRQRASRPKD